MKRDEGNEDLNLWIASSECRILPFERETPLTLPRALKPKETMSSTT